MRKMNRKKEITNLKHELKICKSKLVLFQEFEYITDKLCKDNVSLTAKNKDLKNEVISLRGILYNYQSPQIGA